MGDYAEMMLDGTCCCSCGEYLGDSDGFAAYCSSCKPVETPKSKNIKTAKYKAPKVVRCLHPECSRKFIDEAAMRNHLRTFHIDKDAVREKQEKDKKLNAIRNAAPVLLESLESARSFIFRNAQTDCNTGELICKKTEAELIKIDAAIAAARGN